jgi:hypothetical protein
MVLVIIFYKSNVPNVVKNNYVCDSICNLSYKEYSFNKNQKIMLKKLCLSIFMIATLLTARADEGMWLPMLLGKQVYNDMVKKGLKLTAAQLYSINKPSVKDAIIIFGGIGVLLAWRG